MIRYFVLAALGGLLAGCATPRQSCLSQVTRDQRVLEALTEQTRANVARGYALEERTDVSPRLTFCTGTRNGNFGTQICNRNTLVRRAVPVSIDLDAERAKLRSQTARLAELRGRTDAAARQCAARYPR